MTESQELAEDYISYFRSEGSVSGADFVIDDDVQIRIWQETDDEDEPSKYYIIKADVDDATWNELTDHIQSSWELT